MKTVSTLLNEATRRLDSRSSSPRLDAELLLCHVTGFNRTRLITRGSHRLEPMQLDRFHALTVRREQGEPLAYLTGHREFWSLELEVRPGVLVPRPDTEILVAEALRCVKGQPRPDICDLGTGSGAIALALASERPDASLTATDRSATALTLARRNAMQHRLSNLRFCEGDWFDAIAGRRFDLLVSNPPYIAIDDPALGSDGVAHEPMDALVSGDDGLDDIRHLIEHASDYLSPMGWLLLEHGHDQQPAILELLQNAGFVDLLAIEDLAGIPRVSGGRCAATDSSTANGGAGR